MHRISSFRIAILPILAVVAILVASAPAAAYIDVTSSGNVGVWSFTDNTSQRGANCAYSGTTFNFDKISVRAPVVGPYSHESQKVSWRVTIQRYYQLPNNDQYAYETLYKSPFQSAHVSGNHTANFSRIAWNDPKKNPHGSILAWITIKWYDPHHPTVADGSVKFRVEWYSVNLETGGHDSPAQYWCLEDY